MAVGIFKNPVGGLTPLGYVSTVAAGTPVPINTNVGAQTQSASKPGAGGTNRFRQLIIATDPANTKMVYLIWNNNSGTQYTGPAGANYQPKYVFDKIPPGVQRSYPYGSLLEHVAINIDNFNIDTDVTGEGAFISAIYG